MKSSNNITTKSTLGSDFKVIRKSLNMSQILFGEFVGVSYKTIARVEKDSKSTIYKTYHSISNILDDKQITFVLDDKKLKNLRRFKEKLYNASI